MIIKVCGIKQPENLASVATLPVDILGMIFYPGSPRYVNPQDHAMADAAGKLSVKTAGVFVDETPDRIRQVAGRFGLTYLQLHGHETPETCRELGKEYGLIKAFRIGSAADLEKTHAYEGRVTYFLFDTKTELYGGSGQKFDWKILHSYSLNTPFLLSGGIGPEDAAAIRGLDLPRCAGLDLNSRFELEPGIKDVELMNNFLSEIR